MNKFPPSYLIIILAIFPVYIYSQGGWFFSAIHDETNSVFKVIELPDNSLFSTTYVYDSDDFSNSYCMIKHHDQEGNLIQETKYQLDSITVVFSFIEYDSKDETLNIVGHGSNRNQENLKSFFIFTKWSIELELLEEKIYVNDDIYFHRLRGRRLNGQLFFVVNGAESIYDFGGPGYTFFYKVDNQGAVLKESKTDRVSSFSGHCMEIQSKFNSNDYYCFGGAFVYTLDPNLNVTKREETQEVIPYGLTASNWISVEKYSDSTYLFGTSTHDDYLEGVLSIIEFDSTLHMNNNFSFGEPNLNGGADEKVISEKCLDWVDTSAIYLGAFNIREPEYYIVAKVNSKLVPYWIKYYGTEDGREYFPRDVLATKDGGCIISGSRSYSDNNGGQIFGEAFMQKLDMDGLTTGNFTVPVSKLLIEVYPNPSNGIFKIKLSDKEIITEIEIFDLKGKILHREKKIKSGMNSIMLDYLPNSIYVYRLLRGTKCIGSGKWIKN